MEGGDRKLALAQQQTRMLAGLPGIPLPEEDKLGTRWIGTKVYICNIQLLGQSLRELLPLKPLHTWYFIDRL